MSKNRSRIRKRSKKGNIFFKKKIFRVFFSFLFYFFKCCSLYFSLSFSFSFLSFSFLSSSVSIFLESAYGISRNEIDDDNERIVIHMIENSPPNDKVRSSIRKYLFKKKRGGEWILFESSSKSNFSITFLRKYIAMATSSSGARHPAKMMPITNLSILRIRCS